MAKRQDQIAQFLANAGWAGAARTPLAGDASHRHYDRVRHADGRQQAVLMDAPVVDGEDIGPFLDVGTYLLDQGFSAPRILAADRTNGLILLEDLGDALYARVCQSDPKAEVALYRAAVDLLARLQDCAPPPFLQPYSAEIYDREATLLTDWYLPAVTEQATSAALRADYSGLVAAACAALEGDHSVCVLRDYHAENLLWLPDRAAIARVGLLDFQDALLGHPAYDLVSLLEDARRDTSAKLRAAMIARYLDQTGLPPDAFRAAYATLGAQRNLKIVGIFARLSLRDGKPGYVDLIPRVWAHLRRDLAHPSLVDLKDFIDRHVPDPNPAALDRLRGAGA